MIFEETIISGVWRVSSEPHTDDRGFFARTFCEAEFAAYGLEARFEQSSLSHNLEKGTLRGMHYQKAPHEETKFVRCVRGAVFDVALDLREGSPTRGRWVGEVLSADNARGLYVPRGVAHGFQALCDNADVMYQITPSHVPGLGSGVRWNDPAFAIAWPLDPAVLSARDGAYPDWRG